MSEPIHIISLGAGVQSSTMALMAAAGEITPMPKCAIFADTQAEPQSVYRWLDWLEPRLPFPVHRVSAGSLEKVSLTIRTKKDGSGTWAKSLIPAFIKNPNGKRGIMGRACTADFKVKEIIKKGKSLVGLQKYREWCNGFAAELRLWRDYKKEKALAKKEERACRLPFPTEAWKAMQAAPLVVQWIGISRDEVSRVKPSRDPWILHRHPLVFEVEKRREGCLAWMKSHGYPEPPRSACRFCPFHSDDEWRRQHDEEPDEFALSVKFDYDLREVKSRTDNIGGVPFLHSSMVPLDKVDFSTSRERGQGELFGNDCTGLCGV